MMCGAMLGAAEKPMVVLIDGLIVTAALLAAHRMAPAILLMTTSFVRILVVLGLLRQALGTQQLPPSQVITALAMFMTSGTTQVVESDHGDPFEGFPQAEGDFTAGETADAGDEDLHLLCVRRCQASTIWAKVSFRE